MPFYFRIPLPGPFGYSARIGGKRKRRRRPAQRQQVRSTAPVRETVTFTGGFGDWECSHRHTTARAATLCGLQRKLDEYSELERQIRAIDLTDASPQTRRQHAEQLERAVEGKRQAIREMDAL